MLSAFGRLELQPSTHGSDITTVTLYDTSFREGASTTPCAIGRRLERWSATSISLRAVWWRASAPRRPASLSTSSLSSPPGPPGPGAFTRRLQVVTRTVYKASLPGSRRSRSIRRGDSCDMSQPYAHRDEIERLDEGPGSTSGSVDPGAWVGPGRCISRPRTKRFKRQTHPIAGAREFWLSPIGRRAGASRTRPGASRTAYLIR